MKILQKVCKDKGLFCNPKTGGGGGCDIDQEKSFDFELRAKTV